MAAPPCAMCAFYLPQALSEGAACEPLTGLRCDNESHQSTSEWQEQHVFTTVAASARAQSAHVAALKHGVRNIVLGAVLGGAKLLRIPGF